MNKHLIETFIYPDFLGFYRTEDDGHDDAIDNDHNQVKYQLVATFRRDGGGRRSKHFMKVNVTWNDGVDLALMKQVRNWDVEEEGRRIFYYPMYCGWEFPNFPYFFDKPTHAACWAISRFKRDGLGNCWGSDMLPFFLKFVGRASIKNKDIHPVISPCFKSEIEYRFFAGVDFHQIEEESVITDVDCVELSANTYQQCIQGFKCKQDYQLSSNSIYKSHAQAYCSIITSNKILRQKKRNTIQQKLGISTIHGLVRIEKHLEYLKCPINSSGKLTLSVLFKLITTNQTCYLYHFLSDSIIQYM